MSQLLRSPSTSRCAGEWNRDDLWHIAELSLSDAYAGAFALGRDFGEVFKGSDDEQRMKNIFKVIEGDFNKGLPTRK